MQLADLSEAEEAQNKEDAGMPQLLAGVFVMLNGQLTVSGAPGVNIEKLFLEALMGMAEQREKEKKAKETVLHPRGIRGK